MTKKLFLILLLFLLSAAGPGSGWAEEALTIGTTFSIQQCDYLGLDWQETYLAILDLNLGIIRLGAYWNAIEPREGYYNFSDLDWLIAQAKQRGIPVILTVGMKAPRWPEYFIPAWVFHKARLLYSEDISNDPVLRQATLRFVSEVINHYAQEDAIQYIQVENEALNKFGGKNWQLLKDFLEEEVRQVRALDPLGRPIILTTATQPHAFLRFLVNLFTKGRPIRDNLKLCDILGINVYPIIGRKTLGIRHYVRTHKHHREKRFTEILTMAQAADKPVWVTELQAEPWEPGALYHNKNTPSPSASPELTKYYYEELRSQGFKVFLLWGAEYWYYQKTKFQNDNWWTMAQDIFQSPSRAVPPSAD